MATVDTLQAEEQGRREQALRAEQIRHDENMARLCQRDELSFHRQDQERRSQSSGQSCSGRAATDKRYYDKTKKPLTKKAKKLEERRLLEAQAAAG